MTFAGNDEQIIVDVNIVYQSVFVIYAAAPSLAIFQRLRFSDPIGRSVSLNILYKGIDFFECLFVEHLPLQVFIPSYIRPKLIHRQPRSAHAQYPVLFQAVQDFCQAWQDIQRFEPLST